MIRIEDLHMSFKNREVLKGLTLEMGKGVYALLGPNGSGKTTLMRCLCGLYRPRAGKIECPEQIGYLPQKFGAFKELTVMEMMQYYATLKDIPAGRQKEECLKVLEGVNLEDRANDRIGTLSGGMVRRLGIAQAFLGDPELIIVDEPTAGLDPEERLRFKELIRRSRGGKTILISTHIVEDVDAVCDHIVLLSEGKVITQGTLEELRSRAEGKVRLVPAEEEDRLPEKTFVLRGEERNGKMYLRVLTTAENGYEPLQATLEDSYMLYIKGILT